MQWELWPIESEIGSCVILDSFIVNIRKSCRCYCPISGGCGPKFEADCDVHVLHRVFVVWPSVSGFSLQLQDQSKLQNRLGDD